jgi:hypothetical protein
VNPLTQFNKMLLIQDLVVDRYLDFSMIPIMVDHMKVYLAGIIPGGV